MSLRLFRKVTVSGGMLRAPLSTSTTSSSSLKVGFIGLGHMGSKMALNLYQDGHSVVVYDRDQRAVKNTLQMITKANPKHTGQTATSASNLSELATKVNADVIISMLPNDAVTEAVTNELLLAVKQAGDLSKNLVHVNCSTISPALAETLATRHSNETAGTWKYISSPVFARPDGITARKAVFMVSGASAGREVVKSLLQPMGRVDDFGEQVSAGNVAKLCGNYLIAASIEAMSETMVFAEKHEVDREQVMNLLNTTIFDCLIYRGYGQRVSQRDHRPGGFALELGYKDVTLVQQAARNTKTPMPFLSVLCDRYTSARSKQRETLDWSAIALNVAEDGGLDISKDLERNLKLVQEAQEKNI
jgi:3-hydroxyisobutyrate dehydrogenase-like beta-hydroxyacid dehydrogenase